MYSSSDKTGQDTRPQELAQKEKKYKGCVPVRYELAFLAFSGLTLQYSLKVHLSMAIVAMVKHQPGQNVSLSNASIKLANICPCNEINKNTPPMHEGEFDWDEELQGHILGSYFYGYMCTQIIGGRMAEKFGAKFVYGPSILATSLLTMLSPMAARFHVYVFIVLRVLQGATSGAGIPAMHSMFSKWFPPQERSKFSSIIFSAIYLGSLLTMGLSGVLIEVGGWPLVSYVFGGAAAFWSLLWLLLVYDSPEKHPRISDEEKCYILTGLSVKEEGQRKYACTCGVGGEWTKHLGTNALSTPQRDSDPDRFIINSPVYYKSDTLNHVATEGADRLYGVLQNGFFSALPYLSNLITGVVCGILSQWLRDKGYISHINAYKLFNGIGPAVALVLITVVGCNVTAIVILLGVTMGLRGAFFGGSYLNHMDLAINFSGTISGILHTFINLSGILAPLVAGALTKGEV
uniref:Major facilitator superfamily (MFS) profile domain-containing protein n=1 Tax=Timema cristinae TaxID=61476 RepID=A0A7R9CF82_TIMCR|nr:unnamed protein product [Timema cristinae]